MFTQDRTTLRRAYREAWNKAQAGQPLEPLERQLAEVMERHPEYLPMITGDEDALDRDWLPEMGETNPFLHLGLHLTVLDQLQTDQPVGVRKLFKRLIANCGGDTHDAEHRMMECLAEEIWRMQHDNRAFRDKPYLKCIKHLGGGVRPRD